MIEDERMRSQAADGQPPWDPWRAACPSRELLETIGDRWTVFIVLALCEGPRRHGELRRSLEGVSQKMLTQTLRTLERDGLVSRTVTPTVPPRVDYALTPLGLTLREPLAALASWSTSHMSEVLRHRDAYDARG